ncbi:MAG: gamma-glutamylcyclotransferase family protein [Clostridium sp.]|uniref:gamma-glutamylcyclotransferase family protein n=1 Tax=Clostridium sp. TaxID=1506 RepID=UPI003D6CA101
MEEIKCRNLNLIAFSDIFYFNKSEIEKALKTGKTKFDFDEEFHLRLEEVLNMMNEKDKVYLFVYGTLMRSHRKGHTYLDGAEFKGECTLNGFALYDFGYYPGIVEDIEERVKGELYAVPKDKLSEIDIYEAEGTLYKRKMVKVSCAGNYEIEAYAYIYNKSVTGKTKVEFKFQPWEDVSDNKRTI